MFTPRPEECSIRLCRSTNCVWKVEFENDELKYNDIIEFIINFDKIEERCKEIEHLGEVTQSFGGKSYITGYYCDNCYKNVSWDNLPEGWDQISSYAENGWEKPFK